MSELRDILREEYIKQVNQLDLKMLLEMVEDVMSQPLTVTEEIEVPTVDAASDQETLDMILRSLLSYGYSSQDISETLQKFSQPTEQKTEEPAQNIGEI